MTLDHTASSAESASDPEVFYQSYLTLIHKIINLTARRHRLNDDHSDEFASYVHLKLIDNNYRIFGEFRGLCEPRAYLATVIQRLCQDFRNHIWGKWRPSAEAHRLGETGLLLERLTIRDRHSFEEAWQMITLNHGIKISREALEAMAARLQPRFSRIAVDDGVPEQIAAPDSADRQLAQREWQSLRRRTETALNRVLQHLEWEDRLILKMIYRDGLPMARVARVLKLEQRPLYRRMNKILKMLKSQLTKMGIDAVTAGQVIGREFGDIHFNFGNNREMDQTEPS